MQPVHIPSPWNFIVKLRRPFQHRNPGFILAHFHDFKAALSEILADSTAFSRKFGSYRSWPPPPPRPLPSSSSSVQAHSVLPFFHDDEEPFNVSEQTIMEGFFLNRSGCLSLEGVQWLFQGPRFTNDDESDGMVASVQVE